MAPANRQLPPLVPGLLATALSAPAAAQLPLTIEALLVSEHRLTATLSGSRGSHREPVLRPGLRLQTHGCVHELAAQDGVIAAHSGGTHMLYLWDFH